MSHGAMNHENMETESNITNTGIDVVDTETFEGHVEFGLPALLLGLWWIFNVCCRQYTSEKTNVPYSSTTWFIWNRFPNTPVEPLVLLVACLLITIPEALGNIENGSVKTSALLHIFLYVFPILLSVVQLLQFYTKCSFPSLDYLCLMMSFLMSGFVIIFHLHARLQVNNLVHVLLTYVYVACALAAFLETVFINRAIFALLRGMSAFLVGLDMIHIAFILYPLFETDHWDLHSHGAMNNVLVGFCAEIAVVIIVVIVVYGLVCKYDYVDKEYVKTWLHNDNGTGNKIRKESEICCPVRKWSEKCTV